MNRYSETFNYKNLNSLISLIIPHSIIIKMCQRFLFVWDTLDKKLSSILIKSDSSIDFSKVNKATWSKSKNREEMIHLI